MSLFSAKHFTTTKFSSHPSHFAHDDVDASKFTTYSRLRFVLALGKLSGLSTIHQTSDENGPRIVQKCTFFTAIFTLLRLVIYAYTAFDIFLREYDWRVVVTQITNVIMHVICSRSEKPLVRVIEALDKTTSPGSDRKITIWILVIVVSVVYLVSNACNSLLLQNIGIMSAALTFGVMYQKIAYVMIVTEFLVCADVLRDRFLHLNARVNRLDGETVTDTKIEGIRMQYENLVAASKGMSSSIGQRLLVPIFLIPIELIVLFYITVMKRWRRDSINTYITIVTYLLTIHAISNAGSEIKNAGNECVRSASRIMIPRKVRRTQILMKLLREHICSRSVAITASGICDIDKHLITSIMLSVITYSMVILQIFKET